MRKALKYVRIASFGVALIASGTITSAIGQAASSDVSAVGTLSAPSIKDKELLRFTLSVTNRTSSAINLVRLVGPPDSYQFDSVCEVLENQGIKCSTGKEFSAANGLLWNVLRPNQTASAWGYLTPTIAHKPMMLTVVLMWNSSSVLYSPQSAIVASLGENQVWDWVGLTESRSYETLKIFAIPAALAVIGFFLTRVAAASDNRRIAAERERENTRQERQREESLRAETWKLMLPISHDYAVKYYLPLSGAGERLTDTLVAGQQHLAFFYLLLLAKRAQTTNKAIGGLYFKDFLGEVLIAECWKRLVSIIQGREDQPLNLAVKACMKRLEPNETYEKFSAVLERKPDGTILFSDDVIQQAWLLFQTEVFADQSKLKEGILHLKGFCAILAYESNRPYAYWYSHPTKLKMSRNVEALLRGILEGANVSRESIDTYFRSVEHI